MREPGPRRVRFDMDIDRRTLEFGRGVQDSNPAADLALRGVMAWAASSERPRPFQTLRVIQI